MTEKINNRFLGKRSSSFGFFLLISIAGIIFTIIGLPILVKKTIDSKEFLFSCLIGIPVIVLFLWIWFNTYYLIDKNKLKVKWGPFVWKINISEIKTIRLNQKTIGGTWKPTLSWNCIEIKYKKYRSIFITPERQVDFLNQLKTINNMINIKE